MFMDQRSSIRSLPVTELADCYRRMVAIRHFECLAEEAVAGGHIRGIIHSGVGQEAIAVGVCRNLRPQDPIVSTHRNHLHALAKGVPARAVMAEMFGRVTGSCGGKGGSMHIADAPAGMFGANGAVGASVVIAVGFAQALRFRRSDGVAVAFIGDGSINRGRCLEAMNYAAGFRLPLLIVCEANGWAATARGRTVTVGPGSMHRARALCLRVAEADGNDIEAVCSLTKDALASLRADEGPVFLMFHTDRVRGHTCADPAKCRDPAEHEAFLAQDPIQRARHRLRQRGVRDEELNQIDATGKAAMQAALDAALEAAWPEPWAGYRDIQTAVAAP
jgi:acetoin:2,6-dichlorophenolindophenol oxidoreductase subunit alpha